MDLALPDFFHQFHIYTLDMLRGGGIRHEGFHLALDVVEEVDYAV